MSLYLEIYFFALGCDGLNVNYLNYWILCVVLRERGREREGGDGGEGVRGL